MVGVKRVGGPFGGNTNRAQLGHVRGHFVVLILIATLPFFDASFV
jgi:hypothetical protein